MKNFLKILPIILCVFALSACKDAGKIIYFYGDGCPHCVKVEKFMKKNNLQARLKFQTKEVFHNPANTAELAKYAKRCSLKGPYLPVPLLWTGSKCVVGDKPILQYFKLAMKSAQ